MKMVTLRTIAAVGFAALASAAAVHAQENNLARTYLVVPKAGMGAQFEAALKAHGQWRTEQGDPWRWGISTHETGTMVGAFSIRSSGHSWADFDAYDAGFGARGLMHWQATVQPLVESISSSITRTNTSQSQPNPPGRQLAFVTVTKFNLRPGHEQHFDELMTRAIEAAGGEAPGAWVVTAPVTGGGPGPYVNVVGLYSSWGDMQEPEPSFQTLMIRSMGQQGFDRWLEELGQTFRSIEVWTQRLRPDLEVQAAN